MTTGQRDNGTAGWRDGEMGDGEMGDGEMEGW